METVQLHAAKARLSELVDRAQAGEEVVISRHGKAVARLVSYQPKRARRRLGLLRGKIKFR
ncbi:MAG: type II toxin-antitoxin system prevent-host-death family antitoxin, partial [Burkholderiales bacterium]|nr:type II toxin-antitoxin system prevent-host-death family antitoxin [Burkholderiales bacterium]